MLADRADWIGHRGEVETRVSRSQRLHASSSILPEVEANRRWRAVHGRQLRRGERRRCERAQYRELRRPQRLYGGFLRRDSGLRARSDPRLLRGRTGGRSPDEGAADGAAACRGRAFAWCKPCGCARLGSIPAHGVGREGVCSREFRPRPLPGRIECLVGEAGQHERGVGRNAGAGHSCG
jgi:hypothetical protein